MTISKNPYEGKNVFVGIDVHRLTYSIAVVCDTTLVKTWTVAADQALVCTQLATFFPGATISCAYEAGFSGFGLWRACKQAGISCLVVHPASIATPAWRKVKTDKIDARNLAFQLARGNLRSIHIPSKKQEETRALTRGRAQAVERRIAIGNQLKMLLHYIGVASVQQGIMSEKYCAWAEQLALPREYHFAVAGRAGDEHEALSLGREAFEDHAGQPPCLEVEDLVVHAADDHRQPALLPEDVGAEAADAGALEGEVQLAL